MDGIGAVRVCRGPSPAHGGPWWWSGHPAWTRESGGGSFTPRTPGEGNEVRREGGRRNPEQVAWVSSHPPKFT